MTNIARMHEWDGGDGFTVMALDWTARKKWRSFAAIVEADCWCWSLDSSV